MFYLSVYRRSPDLRRLRMLGPSRVRRAERSTRRGMVLPDLRRSQKTRERATREKIGDSTAESVASDCSSSCSRRCEIVASHGERRRRRDFSRNVRAELPWRHRETEYDASEYVAVSQGSREDETSPENPRSGETTRKSSARRRREGKEGLAHVSRQRRAQGSFGRRHSCPRGIAPRSPFHVLRSSFRGLCYLCQASRSTLRPVCREKRACQEKPLVQKVPSFFLRERFSAARREAARAKRGCTKVDNFSSSS